MAAPKKPQDHKSPKNEATVVEYAGETYTLDADALDLEVLELIEKDKHVSAITLLLGEADFKRFKESVRTDKGKVPMPAFQEFIETVLEALPN